MTVTIFTPTYNRGYIIDQLYQSLCRQTCKDFEWIVIDDGSTDNTEDYFNSIINFDNGFNIFYKKIPNGGKMRAVNKGVQLAQGEVFFIIDSDDYAFDDAVETIITWLEEIKHDKTRYVGVCGRRASLNGVYIGTGVNGEYMDVPLYEKQKYGIYGDQSEVFFTDILKKYPFPEFEGEKFIGEGPTWMNICFKEKKPIRYYNKAIYYCEYRQDGYSKNANSLLKNNVRGFIYNAKLESKFTKRNYLQKLKLFHLPYIAAKLSGWTEKQFRNEMNISFFDYFFVFFCHIFLTKVLKRKY